jgi:general secretion pathway protein J
VKPLRQSGFTLIELIVAVSLMAVLSIIAWRGLDAVLKARDNLTQVGEDMRSLTIAFSQMDEDLRRSWPIRQLLPGQAPIRFVPGATGQGTQLEMLREGGGALDGVRVERVAYRIREGWLERGFASFATGAVSQLSPFEWQRILSGVTQFKVKAWVQGSGWVPGESLQLDLANAAANPIAVALNPTPNLTTSGTASAIATPPPSPATLGVDFELTRTSGQTFTRIFSVRD